MVSAIKIKFPTMECLLNFGYSRFSDSRNGKITKRVRAKTDKRVHGQGIA